MAGLSCDRGWFSIVFRYRGIRVRESLHTQDRAEAERVRKKIERAMREGQFDYQNWFSNSRNLVRLGLVEAGERGVTAGEKLTLGGYAATWLSKKRKLSPGTVAWYEGTLRNHILPAPLASRALVAIKKTDIELFIASLQEKTGKRAVNAAVQRLRSIFGDAFDDDIIEKDPMRKIENIREKRPRIYPFTLEEAEKVIAAADTGWERSLLTVLIFAGLRPNEALALRWETIDFSRRQINVLLTGSRWGVHEPKTAGREEQPVEMLDGVYTALQQQRPRSQLKSQWVFPSKREHELKSGHHDTPIRLENWRDRNWKRIMRKSGLPYRNPYNCRHSFASILLAAKGPQWVAAQMGHTSLQMVISRYTKPSTTQGVNTIEQVEAAIARALGVKQGIAMKEKSNAHES